MTTIEQVVGTTRSMLSASLGNELSRLAQAYVPGDPTIRLAHDKRIPDGGVVSVGLTTLVAASSTTGNEVQVVPGIDGSPDQSAPQGTLVHLRPRHTTWQIFREIDSTISEISSPTNGLYGLSTEQFPVDTVDGTYTLSSAPLKVVRVRYLRPGSDDEWYDLAFDYRPAAGGSPTVRASGAPGGTTVEIVTAHPFLQPERLGDTLTSLNIPDSYARLLAVGAARTLSLATESRRSQPFSQGDPRRAEEVPLSGNAMVYDRLQRTFKQLVADERSRLIQQHPYRQQMERFYARMTG